MRLCIADPPYLGVAAFWYGADGPDRVGGAGKSTLSGSAPKRADRHPYAHLWDDPEAHRALIARMTSDYDGWAVAMKVSSLWHYLQWADPRVCHVAAWTKQTSLPTGTRPIRSWEPVLIRVPDGRRRVRDRSHPQPVRDTIHTLGPVKPKQTAVARASTFAGSKPAQWTRWVLDMLGYDPDQDTVDDLFPGSGAVAAEIRQGTLL